CGTRPRVRRIINGTSVGDNEYPWVVVIRKNGAYQCPGSLITPKHVVTAAHCLTDVEASSFKVTPGAYRSPFKPDYEKKLYTVKAIHPHEKFDKNTYDNDIGLLELENPVALNSEMQLICLPSSDNVDYSGTVGTALGWGRVQKNETAGLIPLQKVDVPIMSKEECLKTDYTNQDITENMFCAGYPEGGKDACNGDSGGPLQVLREYNSYELAGIISWGRGCGDAGNPGVYTKMTNYLYWLREYITDECPCRPHPTNTGL
ncbi:trypsin, partial [Orussus abietinus]|uniref:trypsin n=1 Tax=Orussus abietinus TaxID=222816 RepID=UPI000C715F83